MRDVIVKDLGLIDYMECWTLQQKFFDRLVASKAGGGKLAETAKIPDDASGNGFGDDLAEGQLLLLCEHPHVYTLGKSGNGNNLLIDPVFLERIGATYHRVDRGGDITYHGPGQLVGYPILDLEKLGLGLKDYIHGLEQAIIDTIARYGIKGHRSDGATGVWLAADEGKPLRKIAAIGVRSSHFVTMHGFALNANPAMEYFSYINPCGFTDRGVTSIAGEIGNEVKMDDVKTKFTKEFKKVFGL